MVLVSALSLEKRIKYFRVCFQTMLIWEQLVASISVCHASALLIQVQQIFFLALSLVCINEIIILMDLVMMASGDSDIIKTLPGDQ